MRGSVVVRSVCVVAIVCSIVGSCSSGGKPKPKLYRATGRVTYKGQAVPGAKVMFLGDGKAAPAVGVTDDDGNFTLASLAGNGAAAGKHAVAIMKNAAATEGPQRSSMEEAAKAAQSPAKATTEASLIPKKYSDPATSGLEFEVSASGSNQFEIELVD